MKKNSSVVKKDLLKKAGIISAAMLLGISMMACGSSSGSDKASTEKTTVASEAAKETEKAGEKAEEKSEAQELKGKISEIKDFMFTVTTDDGKSYALNFDKKPEGLDKVKEGDEVIVHYTGELSEVDSFTGEILSVEKA